jgi:hypothetical protein
MGLKDCQKGSPEHIKFGACLSSISGSTLSIIPQLSLLILRFELVRQVHPS